MGFENVGKVWTPQTLKEYLETISPPKWTKSVTLHHCAAPSLAQRPHGLLAQHISNIASFYKSKSWSSAPHLFTDEDQGWGMCDFRKVGVHAISFNSNSIGIEVLGDFDVENPLTGRGLACWQTTAAMTKVLLDWLGLPVNENTVKFHREDPKTTKTCPGTKVKKDWVLKLVSSSVTEPKQTETKPSASLPSERKYVGEKWCVPVAKFLATRGFQESKLRKVGVEFYYENELLEGAFYDVESRSTWAPVKELENL